MGLVPLDEETRQLACNLLFLSLPCKGTTRRWLSVSQKENFHFEYDCADTLLLDFPNLRLFEINISCLSQLVYGYFVLAHQPN